jgi:Terminase large subunit, T4likevirus-type, N-terminal
MLNSQASSTPFNPSSLEALLSRLRSEAERRQSRTKLLRYRPYPKQAAFHAAGAVHRQRLLMAGNQLGKTTCGAAEAAFHLTGKYPDWWVGRRWDRPVRVWAASETWDVTRDGVHRLLIGEPKDQSQWGTGLIPGADLEDWLRRQGAPDALDSAIIKHVSDDPRLGGTSPGR